VLHVENIQVLGARRFSELLATIATSPALRFLNINGDAGKTGCACLVAAFFWGKHVWLLFASHDSQPARVIHAVAMANSHCCQWSPPDILLSMVAGGLLDCSP
jgi:hypothetical protein